MKRDLDHYNACKDDCHSKELYHTQRFAQNDPPQYICADRAKHGLNGASFDVLATLLRAGPPHALSPNQLLATMMVTSGTMTNRIDQLEKENLVCRITNPDDKRSVLVQLTPKGHKIIDGAIGDHVATQTRLVDILGTEERKTLDTQLQRYLSAIAKEQTKDT